MNGCKSVLLRVILFTPEDEYPRPVRMGIMISSRTESSLKSGDSSKE